MNSLFEFKIFNMFIALSFFYVVIAYISNTYVLNDSWYYNFLSEQVNSDRVMKFIALRDKFKWIGYIIIPFSLAIKWIILSTSIFGILFLSDLSLSLKDFFKIVIVAEFANILGSITKIISFLFNPPVTLKEVQFFYPLSLSQLANYQKTPTYLAYALQQVNVFEIFYWFLLMLGVATYTGKKMSESFKLVAASYGVVFCCWILLVTFIQLQMS